jgi:hypothetical protein
MCAYPFSSQGTSSDASRCTERFATLSPSSSSTPMTGRDSEERSSRSCAYMRNPRSPAPYLVRPTLHEQPGARAHAPALALSNLFLRSSSSQLAAAILVRSTRPAIPHVRSRPRSCSSVGVQVSRPWRPRARSSSRRCSASGHGRTRDTAVQTSSTRELAHAGATKLMVRSSFPTFPLASSFDDACAVLVFHIHDSDLEMEYLRGSSLHAALTASVSSSAPAPACASHQGSRAAAPPVRSARAWRWECDAAWAGEITSMSGCAVFCSLAPGMTLTPAQCYIALRMLCLSRLL